MKMKYVIECELPQGEKFIKRVFNNKPAAMQYAEELSMKRKKWVVRVYYREYSHQQNSVDGILTRKNFSKSKK